MACSMAGGCRRGKGMLSAEEAGQIRRWIVEQTPDQLALPFGLWGGARADRTALGQAPRPDGGAALPAALGPDAATALGQGQAAPARRHRGLAGDQLPGDRQA